MKTANLITALLEEKGYEVDHNHKERKINGWEINDDFYLWLIGDQVFLAYRQEKSEKPKAILCQGNPCVTNLHHPKSLDLIELWLDNLDNLHVFETGGMPGTGFGSMWKATK